MDEVLTLQEEQQIDNLLAVKKIASLPLADFTFQRILGISPHVTITNASTKKKGGKKKTKKHRKSRR